MPLTESYTSFELPITVDSIIDNEILPSTPLYLSHFLSTWNSRSFEFGAVLFLATVYPGTLLKMSVYALLRAAAAVLLSHHVGRYIDTGQRLSVVRISILGQRASVVVSCIGFLVLLNGRFDKTETANNIIFGFLIILACAEKLCSIMNTIAIERDWMIVIASTDESLLQDMNSQMRRIDLFCKLIAPPLVALTDGVSTKIAVFGILGLNICSAVIEYPLIARVYYRVPTLAQRVSNSVRNADCESILEMVATEGPQGELAASNVANTVRKQHTVIATFETYVHSPAFLPSFALSMSYLTVLSFSGQMITFLLAIPNPRMSNTIIGFLKIASTMFEFSATYIAPWIMDRIGPVRAGIWCLSWQLLCLTVAVGLLSTPGIVRSGGGIVGFIVGVILSRSGLWSFDLIAQLLVQNSIESSHRGSFSSVEASLQNFFELCTFAMTIVFSRPDQFKYPSLVSLIATCCAAALYAKFVRDRRGHLVHMPDCLKHVNEGRYDLFEQMQVEEELLVRAG